MWGREMEEDGEPKVKLVNEICLISKAFASCAHLRSDARKKVFIDWYLILAVDEDSGLEVIRRRYRQLALQLHPDKNKHQMAELAFKIISEAYACLSDKAKRASFNAERRSNFCHECYRKLQTKHQKNNNGSRNSKGEDDDKSRPRRRGFPDNRVKQYHILQALKKAQDRFREECRVIENCLKASMKCSGRESPLFDPYNSVRFPGYPHRTSSPAVEGKTPGCWFFQPEGAWGQVPCESPVYQIRSQGGARTQSASFY